MNRESGFYWVKYKGTWYVAGFINDEYLTEYCFRFIGSDEQYMDADMDEIDERRIERLI